MDNASRAVLREGSPLETTIERRKMFLSGDATKAFNLQLRETAAVLAGHAGGSHAYGFVCECGCEQVVKLTLGEYDREGGAWLEGHRASGTGSA